MSEWISWGITGFAIASIIIVAIYWIVRDSQSNLTHESRSKEQ